MYEVLYMVEEIVVGKLIDTGAGNDFEDDENIAAISTHYIKLVPTVKALWLTEVFYYLNPTNVVTYQLYLLEGPIADDVEALSKVVFDSGDLRQDSIPYTDLKGGGKLPRLVNLDERGLLYFNVDWSAAPGNTPGLLYVKGTVVNRVYDP